MPAIVPVLMEEPLVSVPSTAVLLPLVAGSLLLSLDTLPLEPVELEPLEVATTEYSFRFCSVQVPLVLELTARLTQCSNTASDCEQSTRDLSYESTGTELGVVCINGANLFVGG